MALVLAATIVHFTLEPQYHPAVAATHTTQLSDREQEQQYCAAWATSQKAVQGGSTSAIREHCQKYL